MAQKSTAFDKLVQVSDLIERMNIAHRGKNNKAYDLVAGEAGALVIKARLQLEEHGHGKVEG